MGRLEGKVAVVTGGTSGIGRACSIAMAREGASVTIVGRREREAAETRSAIEAVGGECLFVQGSVEDAATCRAFVERTVDRFNRLDVALNNAGVAHRWKPLAELDEKEFDNTLAINLKGVFLAMKYEIPAMIASGGGSIINTGSVAASVGSPNLSGYTASKHGVVGLSRAAALEYSAQGVRVNVVSPGLIDTEILSDWSQEQLDGVIAYHPIGRIGRAEEVAATVVFLATGEAGFITGACVAIDGGVTAQ